jgi:hypothetical protein
VPAWQPRAIPGPQWDELFAQMGCARDQALLARYVSSGARASELRNIRDDIEIGYDADLSDVDVLVQDALDRWALIPDDSDVTVDTPGEHGNPGP